MVIMEILDVIDKLANADERYAVFAEKTNNATNPEERIQAMHEQSVNGHEIFLTAADALKELNRLLDLEFDKETADAVFDKIFDCINNGKLDFFIFEMLSKKLLAYYEKIQDVEKIIATLSVYEFSCSELSYLDQDKYTKQALDLLFRSIEYREHPILLEKSIHVKRVITAFFNICIAFATRDKQFVPMGWETYRLFSEWLETDFFKKIAEKFPDILENVYDIKKHFYGGVYFLDPTFCTEEVETKIEEDLTTKLAKEGKMTANLCFDYIAHLRIMSRRNPNKTKDYYYQLADYYDNVISFVTDPNYISGYNTACLETLMDFRSKADFSKSELEASAAYIKKHMFDFIRLELSQDSYSSIITEAIPNMLFNFKIINLFDSPQEKSDLIQKLFISRHISTYMHCNMVAAFSKCILKWIHKKKPELFVGVLDIQSTEEALNNSEKIMNTIHRHAMLHDIGKISIQEVVSRQYRPITDDEFQIIKLHPERGAKYLEVISGLEDCADTARGHHKFYNGQGGYPASFDNTKSPVRLIIDIITLSDCLDAATDYMGRNYRKVKTAAQVVDEFRASAGIRYNPDIVDLMSDPDMVAELDSIAATQRKQIFIESCNASAMSIE